MAETRKLPRNFEAAAFDEELGLLDDMSAQGWQLESYKGFRQTYTYDKSIRYRHAVAGRDLPPEKRADWEFLFEHSKLCFYRRQYDPALPPDAYILMTDPEALMDLKRGTGILAGPLIILLYAFFLPLRYSGPARILLLLGALLLLYRYAASIHHIKHCSAGPAPFRRHLWRYLDLTADVLIFTVLLIMVIFPPAYHPLPLWVSILAPILLLFGAVAAFAVAMDQAVK